MKKSVLAASLLVAAPAHAATFSFTGQFSQDTDLALFEFTLAAPTAGVELRTFAYAGGSNGAGQAIAGGGFEPVLSLFMADGSAMNPGPSGPCGGVLPADSSTGACGDVDYPTTLSFPAGVWAAGSYTVALSSFANPAVGNFADGFFADVVLGISSPGNFTCAVGAPGYQGSPPSAPVDGAFCDEYLPGSQRDGHWALDIIAVDSARQTSPVPLPAPLPPFVVAIALLVARRCWNSAAGTVHV
jgi:hypothetical protein